MDPLVALQNTVKTPRKYQIGATKLNDVSYLTIGDHAYRKDTMAIYGFKYDQYSFQTLMMFALYINDPHDNYATEIMGHWEIVSSFDRESVRDCLYGKGLSEMTVVKPGEPSISLKVLLESGEEAAKQARLDEKRKHEMWIKQQLAILKPEPRVGYSRYSQEEFATVKALTINPEGSYIGADLFSVEKGIFKQDSPKIPRLLESFVAQPAAPAVKIDKKHSRTPIIIVPSTMFAMINLYNARDILQDFKFVPADLRRAEADSAPENVTIQRTKNGVTCTIRIMENIEHLKQEDWDYVIGIFALGATWQFMEWNAAELFAFFPGFHLHYEHIKPGALLSDWDVQMIPVSPTERHTDQARFAPIWDRIEDFVRQEKKHYASKLGI